MRLLRHATNGVDGPAAAAVVDVQRPAAPIGGVAGALLCTAPSKADVATARDTASVIALVSRQAKT